MTEVANTSIQALKTKRENGTLETDRERALFIIAEYGPITSKDMELHMGKNKHTFSGRINELKEDGLVEVTGTEDGHQLLDTTEGDSSFNQRDFGEAESRSKGRPDETDETGEEPSNEFVSMSEDLEDSESTEGLFVDDKQSDVLMENGEIV